MIVFEKEYREKYYKLLDQIFDSGFWSEGKMIKTFEEKFADMTGLETRAVSNGGTGLLAILDYLDVKGKDVVVPANTFWATSQAAKNAGANVIYADCNKYDLCLSYDDLVNRITENTKAVIVVHIGGHIAFEIEKIAALCEEKNIFLIEDCAHVHGGSWHGRTGGHWGFAGSYSFYATKTMPIGEGGAVVSRNSDFMAWLTKYRNYGKEVISGKVTYPIKNGFNYRLNEFSAALGLLQLERLPMMLEWKRELAAKYDNIFENRVKFPAGMISGFYKYIVFDYNLKEETGQVFGKNDLGYRIEGKPVTLPNSEWITEHHKCAPIWFGWNGKDLELGKLKERCLGNGK